MTSRLHERYAAEVVPALQKQFEYGNPNQVPKRQQDRRQHRSRRGPVAMPRRSMRRSAT